MKSFYVYIVTNKYKNVLYTGYTKDLQRRLLEHRSNQSKFSGKYKCHYLIYFEEHYDFESAHRREHQIKSWTRKKKDYIIDLFNPERLILNDLIDYPFKDFEWIERLNFEAVR